MKLYAVAALVCLAVTGCGDRDSTSGGDGPKHENESPRPSSAENGPSPRSLEPQRIVQAFWKAFGEDDGATVCSYLTKEALSSFGSSQSCQAAFMAESARLPEKVKRAFESVRVLRADVEGSTATVTYAARYRTDTRNDMVFLREQGTWRINDLNLRKDSEKATREVERSAIRGLRERATGPRRDITVDCPDVVSQKKYAKFTCVIRGIEGFSRVVYEVTDDEGNFSLYDTG